MHNNLSPVKHVDMATHLIHLSFTSQHLIIGSVQYSHCVALSASVEPTPSPPFFSLLTYLPCAVLMHIRVGSLSSR